MFIKNKQVLCKARTDFWSEKKQEEKNKKKSVNNKR